MRGLMESSPGRSIIFGQIIYFAIIIVCCYFDLSVHPREKFTQQISDLWPYGICKSELKHLRTQTATRVTWTIFMYSDGPLEDHLDRRSHDTDATAVSMKKGSISQLWHLAIAPYTYRNINQLMTANNWTNDFCFDSGLGNLNILTHRPFILFASFQQAIIIWTLYIMWGVLLE